MAKILFGCVPLWGHVNPTIPIVQKLLELGHEVRYACHPQMEETFKNAGVDLIEGFEWGDTISYVSKLVNDNKLTWQRKLKKERNISPALFHLDRLEEGIEDVLELLKTWQPDVCVFDTLFFPGKIAAEVLNIPYATSCTYSIPLESRDLLPRNLGLSSNQKRMGLGNWLMKKVLDYNDSKNIDFLNEVRSKYNLGKTDYFFDNRSPYLYLLYTTDIWEFKISDLIPQAFYIGPSLSSKRGDEPEDFPWEWIEGESPIIYFSMGTVFGNKKLVSKMIKASIGAPWKVVASISGNYDVNDWKNVPENVLLRNYVPQPELLKKVDIVITHGGNGTMNEALSCGIPLIVIPQMMDQFDNAQKALEFGAGLRLNQWLVTSGKLKKAILKIQEDGSFRKNAQKIRDHFAQCDAALVGSKLILKLAESKMPLKRSSGDNPTLFSHDADTIISSL